MVRALKILVPTDKLLRLAEHIYNLDARFHILALEIWGSCIRKLARYPIQILALIHHNSIWPPR
jgi:hypothetical protein